MALYDYESSSGTITRSFPIGTAPDEIVVDDQVYKRVISAPAGVIVQGGTGARKSDR